MKDSQREQVHAYLDDELSHSESVELLAAVDQDPKLSHYFAEMAALRSDLGALREIAVPPGRWTPPPISQPAPKRSVRMWPRIAAALVIAGVGLAWLLSDPDSAHPPGQPAVASRFVPVRFAMTAPAAEVVEVTGDFNGWARGDLRLHDPDGDGVWTKTVQLPRGRYAYMFVVDDAWIADPDAAVLRDDGFGGTNAILEI